MVSKSRRPLWRLLHNAVKKAAAELCRLGTLEAVRGRAGGVRLAEPPEMISIGRVVRHTEGASTLVECFDPASNTCPLIAHCRFRLALQEAQEAFFVVLDRHMLGDLIQDGGALRPLVGLDGTGLPNYCPARTGGDAALARVVERRSGGEPGV